jgi:hypothetical protein
VSFITSNIEEQSSGLLYICGHPGQGKTALLDQTLFEKFGYLDSAFGGTDERLFILKYNAMRYNSDHSHFLRVLKDDLVQLGCSTQKKPIKLLKRKSFSKD